MQPAGSSRSAQALPDAHKISCSGAVARVGAGLGGCHSRQGRAGTRQALGRRARDCPSSGHQNNMADREASLGMLTDLGRALLTCTIHK
jgi:hypothetical protein